MDYSIKIKTLKIKRQKLTISFEGRTKVNKSDVEEIHSLFYDAKSSAKLLHEQASKYIS